MANRKEPKRNLGPDGIPGFIRPDVRTPKNFPYQLKRDTSKPEELYGLTYNDKYGGIYLGLPRITTKKSKTMKINEDGTLTIESSFKSSKNEDENANVKPCRNGLIYTKTKTYKFGKKDILRINKKMIPGELSFSRVVKILAGDINMMKAKELIGVSEINSVPSLDLGFRRFSRENPEEFIQREINYKKDEIKFFLRNELRNERIKISIQTRRTEIAASLLYNKIWHKRGFIDKKNEAPKKFWHWILDDDITKGDSRTLKTWWVDCIYREIKDLPNIKILWHKKNKSEPGKLIKIKRSEQTNDQKSEPLRRRAFITKIINQAIRDKYIPEKPWEIRGWEKLKLSQLITSISSGLHLQENWSDYEKSNFLNIDNITQYLKEKHKYDNFYPLIPNTIEKDNRNRDLNQIINKHIHNSLEITSEELYPETFLKSIPNFPPPDGWSWDINNKTFHEQKEAPCKIWTSLYCERDGILKEAKLYFVKSSTELNQECKWRITEINELTLSEIRELKVFERILNIIHKIPDMMEEKRTVNNLSESEIVNNKNIEIIKNNNSLSYGGKR